MKDLSNENIIHLKKGNTEYLQFRRLLEYPELQHCYTLRHDGLNFKMYEEDDSILKESYNKISEAVGFDSEKIVKPHQTHTDKIENVTNANQKFEEVDGVVTNQEGITLCTTSADCTALLFYDPVKKVIADVHSGWRGTLQKIGQKTVIKMIEEYNCQPEDIICCICPCIKTCHFEVEEDVEKLFYDTFKYTNKIEKIIQKGRSIETSNVNVQKYQIDTTLINILLLEEIGLKEENIIDSGICTVCNPKEFHSYRVDKENSGRNAAMIKLGSSPIPLFGDIGDRSV